MIRRRVLVQGHVQGVFFRDTTRRLAVERGTVEAVFEGEHDSVDALVRFCEHGPHGASVSRLEVIEEEREGLTGFRVM